MKLKPIWPYKYYVPYNYKIKRTYIVYLSHFTEHNSSILMTHTNKYSYLKVYRYINYTKAGYFDMSQVRNLAHLALRKY